MAVGSRMNQRCLGREGSRASIWAEDASRAQAGYRACSGGKSSLTAGVAPGQVGEAQLTNGLKTETWSWGLWGAATDPLFFTGCRPFNTQVGVPRGKTSFLERKCLPPWPVCPAGVDTSRLHLPAEGPQRTTLAPLVPGDTGTASRPSGPSSPPFPLCPSLSSWPLLGTGACGLEMIWPTTPPFGSRALWETDMSPASHCPTGGKPLG